MPPESLKHVQTSGISCSAPFPNGWFPHIYKGTKDAGHELESYKGEHMAVQAVEDICEKLCEEIWPGASMNIGIVAVIRCRDGDGIEGCENGR